MPLISANGTGIFVECYGDANAIPILLIRGLGSQIIHWPQAMLERFTALGFQVITPDNRDAGLSQKVEEAYGVADMARDHFGVLDHFGIARAHVLGISMGGMIAQTMAAMDPGRVVTMTSVMSSSGDPDLPQCAPEVRRLLLASPEDPDDRDSVIAFTLACDRVWGSPGYPFDEAERADLIGRAWDRCWAPHGVARQYEAVLKDASRVDRLGTITVPTLVVHGLDDTLLPPEHGRDTARRIPGSVLIEVPGMGHDLEGDLAAMIAEFAARHARAADREELVPRGGIEPPTP